MIWEQDFLMSFFRQLRPGLWLRSQIMNRKKVENGSVIIREIFLNFD